MGKVKVKPALAVIILLIITIAASGGAFYWLRTVKIGPMQPGCDDPKASFCIQKVSYNKDNNDLILWLYNKEAAALSILKDAPDKDKTHLTIFTGQGTLRGCAFKSLSDLSCDANAGLCEGMILPGTSSVIKLKGSRNYCKLSEPGEYWLRIDLKEDTIRKQFLV